MATNPNPRNSYWQQTVQNRMLLVVLGMVVLVPLLASPSNPAMQGIATKALQLMAALLAGILVMRARVASRRSEVVTFLGVGPNLAVLLYLLVSAITVFTPGLSPRDPAVRLFGISEFQRILAGVLLYFALAYHIRRSEHLVKIQDALVFVAGLLAILGLLSLAQSGRGQVVLMGDHQLFGAFLMILLPIPVVAALTERDSKKQITAQVAAAVTGICIIMTGTRTAWLGAAASMVALAVFSLIGNKKKKKAPVATWKQYVIPLLTVVVCALLYVLMGGAASIYDRLGHDSANPAIAYRHRMWYAAEQMIIQKPIFGVGLGAFPVYQQPYSQSGRPKVVVLQNRPTLAEMAHNFWLQTAAEQGLVGVGLFATIIITFLIAGLRRLRYMEGGLRRSLLLACLAGIIGFCVDAVGNPAWQFAQVSMFFWLILGLGVASLRPRTVRQESHN